LAKSIEYEPDIHLKTRSKKRGKERRSPRDSREEELFFEELRMINENLDKIGRDKERLSSRGLLYPGSR
ncbi:MAG: hypothetical protein JSV56_03830, partial [Methanomassiliicoccales archaeon]